MIATKKLLQYSISFCIGISYIFVITSFAFADDANWLTGQRFLDAKEALEYGRFDEAEKILANLSTKKGLESWVNLYLAEIALEKKQKDKSKSLLGKISPTSAASFYSQYLSMKIDYASGVALSKSRVDSIMKNAKNYGISSIEQNLEFIEILLTQKKGETLEFIKQLQDFRRKNPKSPAALAALRLQRSIVGDPVSATPLLTTLRTSIPEYWATEIQLLLLQGLVNEAADLLKQLRGSNEYFQSLLESDLKLIEAQVALLRASRQMDSYKELLGKLQTNSDPDILQFAWKETARHAWNQNDYETARSALQRLPEDLAYRQFIEARIAEENSDLDSAKTLYSSVVESADKEFAFSSARHLSLLLILGKKWDEATKMLEKAASLAQAEGFLEKDSIEFWSRYVKHRGKLPRSGEPYRYRSVYYWLEEGRKFTKPSEPDLVFPDRLILRRFCPQNSKLLSKELRDRLLALQSYGLYDLIADEVKFALPRSQDEEQMFNRISELSAYGASADAFRDLLSSSLMESAFHRRCTLNVIKALYPVPFMEAFSDAATESGLEVALLLAIARTESAFNPRAWSAKNAMGLMQILPSTAELEGIKASTAAQRNLLLSNPNTSAQLGAAHLKKLITQYEGKWHYAIAAYNAGSTVTNRWKQRFPDAPEELWVELISYKETRDYVKKVMAAYWIYSDLVL